MGRNDDNNQRLLFKESISSLLSEYFSHHADVLEFVNSLTELCFSREQWKKKKKKKNAMNNNSTFILEVGEMVIAKAIRLSFRPRDEGTGDVREVDGTVSLRCCLF